MERSEPPEPAAGPADLSAEEDLRAAARRRQGRPLERRTILMIGGVLASKKYVWETARAAAVRIVLVDAKPPPPSYGLGDELHAVIVVPRMYDDHSDAGEETTCADVLRALAERSLGVDGVVTFIEDCTVLTARLAERLRLRGNSVLAQKTAKSKLATLEALARTPHGEFTSDHPTNRTLAPAFVDIHSPSDVRSDRASHIRYPAVLKHYYGSGAIGTRVVDSPEIAERQAAQLLALVRDPSASETYALAGFRHGEGDAGIILMDFVEGSEHDVDLVLFDGELLDAFVTDNGRVDLPLCAETSALMPSAVSPERQRELITAAYQTCSVLGLRDGVVNVELKLSALGPRVLEVNGRMAGAYIPPWIHAIWGIDLAEAAYMIACGIRPSPRPRSEPRFYLAGVHVYPSDDFTLDAVRAQDAFVCELSNESRTSPPREYEEPDASVAGKGATPAEAVERARALLPLLLSKDRARVMTLDAMLEELAAPPAP